MTRRSSRQTDAADVVVRLTQAALGDLQQMQRKGDPQTVPLAEAIDALRKAAYGLEAAREPKDQPSTPDWLIHALVHVVKMPREEVACLRPWLTTRLAD